ncbi:MAG: stalk domain-containing protein [Candidatus Woesearchaeota archaeon]
MKPQNLSSQKSLEETISREEEKNLRRKHSFAQKIKAAIMTTATAAGILSGVLSFKPGKANASQILLGEDTPKVEAPMQTWYLLNYQPLEAIIREVYRKDIKLWIGKTEATIDEQNYTLDAAPYIKNSRTMVPLRFISEGLGATVSWDGTQKKVTIQEADNTIELWIGKTTALVNGTSYTLNAAPEIKNSRTFVPIRFVSENLNANVSWNSATKEVGIYREKVSEHINMNSDADKDGLTFAQEQKLGTNPNNKNTIYNTLTDKQLYDLVSKYPALNIFAKNPDGKTRLTLPDKVKYDLDPLNPFNLDDILNDELAIRYAAANNSADGKAAVLQAVQSILQKYGQKLGTAAKQATAASTISPEELDAQANTAKQQVESSFQNRAYNFRSDGSAITIEDLTSTDRYRTLISLNKLFAPEDINILLSESPTLQKGNLSQYSQLINSLIECSNAQEQFLNEKVKDTNTFKQNINQLSLYDNNTAELIIRLWNENESLRGFIASHPKTTLAVASAFSNTILEQGRINYDGKEYDLNSPEAFERIKGILSGLFNYFAKTEETFKSQKLGFAQSIYHNSGIESYTLIELQGLAPITAADICDGVFASTLKDQGVSAAISMFDVNELLPKLYEVAMKNYHMRVASYGSGKVLLDWLNPEIGPASIRIKLTPFYMSTRPDIIEGGIVFKSDEKKNPEQVKDVAVKALSIMDKFSFTTDERIKAREIEMVGVEKLINIALLRPVIENLYAVDLKNNTAKSGTGSAIDRMDAESEKLARQIGGATIFNLEKLRSSLPAGRYSDANVIAILLYTEMQPKDLSTYEKNPILLPCRIGPGWIIRPELVAPVTLNDSDRLYFGIESIDKKIEGSSLVQSFGSYSAESNEEFDRKLSVAKSFIPYPGVKM